MARNLLSLLVLATSGHAIHRLFEDPAPPKNPDLEKPVNTSQLRRDEEAITGSLAKKLDVLAAEVTAMDQRKPVVVQPGGEQVTKTGKKVQNGGKKLAVGEAKEKQIPRKEEKAYFKPPYTPLPPMASLTTPAPVVKPQVSAWEKNAKETMGRIADKLKNKKWGDARSEAKDFKTTAMAAVESLKMLEQFDPKTDYGSQVDDAQEVAETMDSLIEFLEPWFDKVMDDVREKVKETAKWAADAKDAAIEKALEVQGKIEKDIKKVEDSVGNAVDKIKKSKAEKVEERAKAKKAEKETPTVPPAVEIVVGGGDAKDVTITVNR